MDLVLTRQAYNSWGIISSLTIDGTKKIATTLEHAYQGDDGFYYPKVPRGTYTCVRGEHQLAGMTQPFTTFEITGVVGHVNILFHVGNYNNDSEGCVLVGSSLGDQMIVSSRVAFAAFMQLQDGCDSFQLTVII